MSPGGTRTLLRHIRLTAPHILIEVAWGGYFVERAQSPYAVLLSENDFSRGQTEQGTELRCIPLYAAHCLGEDLVRVD